MGTTETQLRDLLVWWSDKTGEPVPIDKESIHSILDRLESIGLLTTEEKELYKKVEVPGIIR